MQRLTSLFLTGALILVLCNTSCTEVITPIFTPKEIIPLKIGNEWHYENANYLPVFNDTLIREFSVRIVGDTVIEGKKYFKEYTYANSLIPALTINLPDGYYFRRNNKNYLAIPYPITLGNKYKTAVFDSNDQLVRFDDIEITALNKETTVKAGKFTCYEETYFSDPFTYKRYTAIGYGEVEILAYDSRNILVARTQLLSYKIQ